MIQLGTLELAGAGTVKSQALNLTGLDIPAGAPLRLICDIKPCTFAPAAKLMFELMSGGELDAMQPTLLARTDWLGRDEIAGGLKVALDAFMPHLSLSNLLMWVRARRSAYFNSGSVALHITRTAARPTLH